MRRLRAGWAAAAVVSVAACLARGEERGAVPFAGQFDASLAELNGPPRVETVQAYEQSRFLVWRQGAQDAQQHAQQHAQAEGGWADEVDVRTADAASKVLELAFKTRGPLGLQFDSRMRIMAFVALEGGRQGVARKSGLLRVGDLLVAVNGDSIEGLRTPDAVQVLEEAAQENARTGAERVFRFRLGAAAGAAESAAARLGAAVAGAGAGVSAGAGAAADARSADAPAASQGAAPESLAAPSRVLSEDAAAAQQGGVERLEVTAPSVSAGKSAGGIAVAALMAHEIGISPLAGACDRPRRLVFVEPRDACSDVSSSSVEALREAVAVVWRGGGCSFLHKATRMVELNASAVVVVNSEDSRIRMRRDELVDNELRIPVAMISSIDGAQLYEMQARHARDLGRFMEGRLAVGAAGACVGADEAGRVRDSARAVANATDAAAGSAASELLQSKLTGVLAPAGWLQAEPLAPPQHSQQQQQQQQQQPALHFDFLAAAFSGPLPSSLEWLSVTDSIVRAHEPLAIVVERWDEQSLHELLGKVRRANDAAAFPVLVILGSPQGAALRSLPAPLPSPASGPVVMVSAAAASELARRRGWRIRVEPQHGVKHRWDELRLLEAEPASWPAEARARRRLVARLAKAPDSLGRDSGCLKRHLEGVVTANGRQRSSDALDAPGRRDTPERLEL